MTDNNDNLPPDDRDLTQKLNSETGRISWEELQRHFALGIVLVVSEQLDLIDVAVKLSEDDKHQCEIWLNSEQLWRASDEDARQWHTAKTEFWSVVVAPWVLVQAING